MKSILWGRFAFLLAISAVKPLMAAPNLDRIEQREFARFSIETNPTGAAQIFEDLLNSAEKGLLKTHHIARHQKLGLIDSGVRKLAGRRNQQLDEAMVSISESLGRLRLSFVDENVATLIRFNESKKDLLWILQESAEAIFDRLASVTEHAALLKAWVDSYLDPSINLLRFTRMHSLEIRSLFHQSTDERIYKVWVNRQNIETVAIASLLAAQGACIILSAGICAATIPATQGLTVSSAIASSQSTLAIAYGSINLIDRYRAEGVKGLASLGAIVDVLLIVSGTPGPSKALLMNGYRSLSPALFRQIATTQYQAGFVAGGILAGYGSWQLLKAEDIAARYSRDGVEVSADEIRRQGAMNLVFGGLALGRSYQKNQQWKHGTEVERKLLESASVTRALKRILKTEYRTIAPYKEINRVGIKLFNRPGASGISRVQLWKDMGFLAYSTLFYHAAAVLSVAYPDFNHAKVVQLPELGENEIALTLNGFEKHDLLYHAFESRHARRHELDRYQENVNYFYDHFVSSHDLMEKIALYGQRGKIKYLRIMAHGIPGKIATLALDIEGSKGKFFDAEWIQQNLEEVRIVSLNSMAKNATVHITSCLVGANLENDIGVKDFKIHKNAGDEFIAALGDSLLWNGGTVHTSRRLLLGFDALYGSVGASFLQGGPIRSASAQFGDDERRAFENSRELISLEGAQIIKERARLEEELLKAQTAKEKIDVLRMIKENSVRLVKTYSKVWSIVNKYGIQIEGPLFGTDRFRIDEIPAK